MFNSLDAKILSILFETKEPIASKDLAFKCDVAINTLRKEITLINQELELHGFRIDTKPSVGHSLEITNKDEAYCYIERLKYIFARNKRMGNVYSPKIFYLTRRCLSANDNLTVDSLCDELFCSRSTVLRDLDKVKALLAKFNLKLKNRTKTHGLYVEGNEWNIRQCLIYQHKIYKLSLDHNHVRDDSFKALFFMLGNEDYYQNIRDTLIDCLSSQSDFTISVVNYPKIIHYIQLSLSRKKYDNGIHFTDEQIERVVNTAEYQFTKDFCGRLPEVFTNAFTINEYLAISMLLLSYETQNRNLVNLKEYASYYNETLEMIDYVSDIWGINKGVFDQDFINDWIVFLYTLDNRRIFKVYDDTEYLGVVEHKGIQTSDFCVCFARYYKEKHAIVLSRQDTIAAFYLFRRVLREDNYCYYQQNILVVSQYGISFAKALVSSIRNGYKNEVGLITAKEYGENWKDDNVQYNLLITDLGLDRIHFFDNYHLPIIAVNFWLNRTKCEELDVYLNNYRCKAQREILTKDSFYNTNLKNKEEVFDFIAYLFKDKINPLDIVQQLKENDEIVEFERNNSVVLMPLFISETSSAKVIVLVNKEPFVWNDNKSQIFVCYSRVHNVKDNQIVSEILSKFVHISDEDAYKLINSDPDKYLEVLYPEV